MWLIVKIMSNVNNAKSKLASPKNSKTNVSCCYTEWQALPSSTNLQYLNSKLKINFSFLKQMFKTSLFKSFSGSEIRSIPISLRMCCLILQKQTPALCQDKRRGLHLRNLRRLLNGYMIQKFHSDLVTLNMLYNEPSILYEPKEIITVILV